MTDEPNDRPWTNADPTGRLLRPSEVTKATGLSRSQIYQMIADGRFPPFLKISARASALPEAWLTAFIEDCANKALGDAQ